MQKECGNGRANHVVPLGELPTGQRRNAPGCQFRSLTTPGGESNVSSCNLFLSRNNTNAMRVSNSESYPMNLKLASAVCLLGIFALGVRAQAPPSTPTAPPTPDAPSAAG